MHIVASTPPVPPTPAAPLASPTSVALGELRALLALRIEVSTTRATLADLLNREASQADLVRILMRSIAGSTALEKIVTISHGASLTPDERQALAAMLSLITPPAAR